VESDKVELAKEKEIGFKLVAGRGQGALASLPQPVGAASAAKIFDGSRLKPRLQGALRYFGYPAED